MEPPEDITLRISETVADATEMPIEALPPLSDAIDPDALAALMTPKNDGTPPGVTVTFRYAGLELIVRSTGVIYAQPVDEEMADRHPGVSSLAMRALLQ